MLFFFWKATDISCSVQSITQASIVDYKMKLELLIANFMPSHGCNRCGAFASFVSTFISEKKKKKTLHNCQVSGKWPLASYCMLLSEEYHDNLEDALFIIDLKPCKRHSAHSSNYNEIVQNSHI